MLCSSHGCEKQRPRQEAGLGLEGEVKEEGKGWGLDCGPRIA